MLIIGSILAIPIRTFLLTDQRTKLPQLHETNITIRAITKLTTHCFKECLVDLILFLPFVGIIVVTATTILAFVFLFPLSHMELILPLASGDISLS